MSETKNPLDALLDPQSSAEPGMFDSNTYSLRARRVIAQRLRRAALKGAPPREATINSALTAIDDLAHEYLARKRSLPRWPTPAPANAKGLKENPSTFPASRRSM